MKYKIILLLLFSIFLWANDLDTLDANVKKYIAQMEKANGDEIWDIVYKLENLTYNASPAVMHNFPKIKGDNIRYVHLGCLKALLEWGDEYVFALETLIHIINSSNNTDIVLKAIQLFALYGNEDWLQELRVACRKIQNKEVKIALIKLLWKFSSNKKKIIPETLDILLAYLNDDDVKIQNKAALALGEMKIFIPAKPFLLKLKYQPTEDGRLARILLEQEERQKKEQQLVKENKLLEDQKLQVEAKLFEKERLFDKIRRNNQSEVAIVQEVVDDIMKYHVNADKINRQRLIYAGLKAMASSTDKFSCFWDEQEWNSFNNSMNDKPFAGIGVYLQNRKDFTIITETLYTGPAYKAGIRSQDKILFVDDWNALGQPIDEITSRVKGPEGTKVFLTVERVGETKPLKIAIIREYVKFPTAAWQLLPNKIGYFSLQQFGQSSIPNLDTALKELSGHELRGFIIDLRGNGGGFLKSAAEMVERFLPPNKLIVYSKGHDPVKGGLRKYFSDFTHPYTMPLIVLIDRNSASASEIVSGSLQCHKRALLIGERSYGKGSVQEPMILKSNPNTCLKLTIAMYYLPNDTCIHNVMTPEGKILQHNGIKPDIEVLPPKEITTQLREDYLQLDTKQVFRKYIIEHIKQDESLFRQLAENDLHKKELYPDFDKFVKEIKQNFTLKEATEDDLRKWIRKDLRIYLSEKFGHSYACDYQEDACIQKAIEEIEKENKQLKKNNNLFRNDKK